MIPYLEWKTVQVGPVVLQVWGFFAALGVVLASAFAVRLAKRRGLDAGKIESLAFWTIVAAFAGARAFHVLFYEPAYYFSHPLEIFSVWKGGLSSFGGFFGAGAAAAWQIRKLGLPFLKTADVAIPATVLGLGCGRIGCFLIHDHPGTLAYGAGKWLAVNYPDGPRYDLGMLLGLFDFLLFGAFLLLLRKPRKDGFHLALFMAVYGPVRFFLDFLRTLDTRYFGLTPAQYGSIALFACGLALMYRLRYPEGNMSEASILKSSGRYWLWLALGAPLIILTGLAWAWSQDQAFRKTAISHLDDSALAAVVAVDPARFERLAARPEDGTTEDYERLRTQLAGLTRVFSVDGLRGLYAMKIDGEEIRFFVDSAPVDDPWHSEPGVVYQEPPPAVAEVAADGKLRFTGPYTDEYGSYYSAFAPVFGQDGGIPAVMGADIEVAAYDKALWDERTPAVAATLLVLAAYIAVIFFVIKRQQKLQLVRHYTRRLEVLIDQMPVGVLIVEGGKGYPTMTNEAALRLLGRDIDPSKGADAFVKTYGIVRADGSPYPEAGLPISVTLATGRQASKTGLFIRQRDGSRIAVRMASVPIRDEKERIAAIVVVLEDMTKEYEIDRQKTEFISIAAHELRSPLTAIKWNTDLLLDEREGVLNADQKIYATHISEINARLVALVTELLDVSRLETGSVGVTPSKTDLPELIEDTLDELAGLYEKKRQKLVYVRRRMPDINVDTRLVRQVLANLVSNAVKYTPEGGAITVEAEARDGQARVSVTDNGIGIPKAQQSQMFTKFFRADNAAANGIEGTGLGLYICKQAVELSGGTIGFESEENKGATFWFTLPLSGSVKKEAAKRLS